MCTTLITFYIIVSILALNYTYLYTRTIHAFTSQLRNSSIHVFIIFCPIHKMDVHTIMFDNFDYDMLQKEFQTHEEFLECSICLVHRCISYVILLASLISIFDND